MEHLISEITKNLTHLPFFNSKVKGKLSTCAHSLGCPSRSQKQIGPDSFSVVWDLLHHLHNKPVTFPAFPVPIYTPGSRGVIMVKCLTQGHNMLMVMGSNPQPSVYEPSTYPLDHTRRSKINLYCDWKLSSMF